MSYPRKIAWSQTCSHLWGSRIQPVTQTPGCRQLGLCGLGGAQNKSFTGCTVSAIPSEHSCFQGRLTWQDACNQMQHCCSAMRTPMWTRTVISASDQI